MPIPIMLSRFPIIFFYTLLPLSMARRCTIVPADEAWPSKTKWNAFNSSVNGRLIKTIPVASVCHGNNFDAQTCAVIQANWHLPDLHESSSSSIMSASFSNRSCDPFLLNGPCSTGSYVEYTVNVSNPMDVMHTVKFAQSHNIRFVVRNTGHDYMGKSTGHGGLAVWMHYLTDTEWFDTFKSKDYKGPAVKMQAGVSVHQMYTEASARGFAIVGGDCPSVGMAGGFIQGGGVGPLSTIWGLLADHALAYEVVTTTGHFVTATPTENVDLFWALSGGGPGTYGIIWSVTVKVQPDIPISGATVTFSAGDHISLDTWWQGVNAYREMTASLTAAGGYSLAVYTAGVFQLMPVFLPNRSTEELSIILDPFLTQLGRIRIPFNITKSSFPGFLHAHDAYFPSNSPLFEVQNAVVGSWLLPKSLWRSSSKFDQLNTAIRAIIDDGAAAYDISVAPSAREAGKNSVLPQWREAQSEFAFFLPWNDTGSFSQTQQQQNKVTNVYLESLKRVAPESGSYMNEADAFDKDWKTSFYGSNYGKLLAIKDKWDPDQLLYGSTAVGGDRWDLQDDGRLCEMKQ